MTVAVHGSLTKRQAAAARDVADFKQDVIMVRVKQLATKLK